MQLIAPTGGPERTVGVGQVSPITQRIPSSIAWTPDGLSLLIINQDGPDRPEGVFLLPLDGHEKRRLTSPPPGQWDAFPALSPDRRTLVFSRGNGIFMVPLSSDLRPQAPKTIMSDTSPEVSPGPSMGATSLPGPFRTPEAVHVTYGELRPMGPARRSAFSSAMSAVVHLSPRRENSWPTLATPRTRMSGGSTSTVQRRHRYDSSHRLGRITARSSHQTARKSRSIRHVPGTLKSGCATGTAQTPCR